MHPTTTVIAFLTFALLASSVGCAKNKGAESAAGYETVNPDPRRDTAAADKHNADAMRHMERGEHDRAEASLKSALAADVMHGPAHNNLGKVYYHQGKLYLAAWEFQYAAKLMPGVPEPRNNLGLVFESAGKLDDAVAQYDEAARMSPDEAQFLGNLARARVRRGDHDAGMRDLLDRLILRETRPEWADWARAQLSALSARPAE